jgi:alginate O-acetyltransferase complex protein AlgI
MVFSSLIFLFFFLPFILIGNYLWRNRAWQNIFLLVGSLVFYAWGEQDKVIIMIVSILFNYAFGILIERKEKLLSRNILLAIGVTLNLSTLVYFKYASFFVSIYNDFLDALSLSPVVIEEYATLPIGISFYTFQSISYLVDVSRRQTSAQKNVINLGLYISLFPQLIAGPIVRYQEIEDQLVNRFSNLTQFNEGIRRFVRGLGKKVLIADPIAYIVDEIFMLSVGELTTPIAWFAALCYGIQVYFDFSGYSDMAIGLGKMFGFKFPENFNYPFKARSIRDFWTRWHMTLSIWFRDYLYIPLGGNRKGKVRTLFNLFTIFFVVGLWHGANWNFINYGLYMGIFIVIEKVIYDRTLGHLPSILQTIYMLLIVNVGWIIFRLEDAAALDDFLQIMFGFKSTDSNYTINMFTGYYSSFLIVLGALLSYPTLEYFKIDKFIHDRPIIDWLLYFSIFILSVVEIVNNVYSPFIYFRF